MNFHDLRIIVSQIKRNIRCPKCESKFIDDDIEIIGALGEDQIFVHSCCHECDAEAMINVTLQMGHDHDHETLPHFNKKLGMAPRMGIVNTNEVLDVHNFLKNFKGDFKTLFQTEK